MKSTLLAMFLTWSVAAQCVQCAWAQGYPTRSVRIAVPFAPRGGADVSARIVGQRLTESWGQTVVIDNRGIRGGDVVWLACVRGYACARDRHRRGKIAPRIEKTGGIENPAQERLPIHRVWWT
jgi:hypothetical protein